jgi:hypothetical protein
LFEEAIGRVERYDPQSGMAEVRVERGSLALSDIIRIIGDDDADELIEAIKALEIGDEPVESATQGAIVRIPLAQPVAPQADVFIAH